MATDPPHDPTSWPFAALRYQPHLTIEDREFAWIGALVCYWSKAEHALEDLILALSSVDDDLYRETAKARIVSFDKKIDIAKKRLRDTCKLHPLFQEIGRALMIKGKAISVHRKRFAHWVANRSETTSGMRMVDPAWPPSHGEEQTYSPGQLIEVTKEIQLWGLDVFRFNNSLLFHGPAAARGISPSPTPDWAILRWDTFHTIQKNDPTHTK